MNILLVSDNLRIAHFLQKGFEFENLFTSLEAFSNIFNSEIDLNLSLFKYQAVIFHNNDVKIIRKIYASIKNLQRKILFVILSDYFLTEIEELLKGSKLALYYVKPFHFRSISSEVRFKVFKLQEKNEQTVLIFRDITMNLETHEVFFKNKKVLIRNKEFALLQFFILNQGKLLSRITILENVWDFNAHMLTNTVDVHISRLRKILKTDNNDLPYIKTVSCLGYILS